MASKIGVEESDSYACSLGSDIEAEAAMSADRHGGLWTVRG